MVQIIVRPWPVSRLSNSKTLVQELLSKPLLKEKR